MVKERNNSIDIFRLVCSIMVMMIHFKPFNEINQFLGYFLSEIFPRIAVPFFFAVSGYYYALKLDNNENEKFVILYKQVLGLLKVYFVWSLIYFGINLINYLINEWSLIDYMVSSIINFFVYGSYYHLWFFPSLFLSLVIYTIAYKSKDILFYFSILLYLLGVMGCSYYTLFEHMTGLKVFFDSSYFELIRRMLLMGFPFFMLGTQINKFSIKIGNGYISILLLSLSFFIECILINFLKLQRNNIITIMLYPLVLVVISYLINHPLSHMKNIGKISRDVSQLIYMSHPLIKLILNNCDGTLLFFTCIIFFLTIFFIKMKRVSVKMMY